MARPTSASATVHCPAAFGIVLLAPGDLYMSHGLSIDLALSRCRQSHEVGTVLQLYNKNFGIRNFDLDLDPARDAACGLPLVFVATGTPNHDKKSPIRAAISQPNTIPSYGSQRPSKTFHQVCRCIAGLRRASSCERSSPDLVNILSTSFSRTRKWDHVGECLG